MSDAEITLTVTPAEEGGFVATWDDPRGGGIATQGEDLRDLQDMVRDAVGGYFQAAGAVPPRTVRLHFVEDPALAIPMRCAPLKKRASSSSGKANTSL